VKSSPFFPSDFVSEFEEGGRGEYSVADRDNKFVVLFLREQNDLRAFIGSMVLDRHAVEDVYQDCAMTLWKQFGQYDEARSFGAWTRGVALNLIRQRLHQDRRFPVTFSPETIRAVLDAYDRTVSTAAPRNEALAECLKELPDHSRQLLVQRYETDCKPTEIAQATGRTVNAIYQALSRIRAILEQCIRRRIDAAEALPARQDT